MVILQQGGAEERHNGVADELVKGTPILEDDVGGERKELVEESSHFLRWQALASGGKADDVGKENRGFTQGNGGAIGARIRKYGFDHGRRVVALEAVAGHAFATDSFVETCPLDGHRSVIGERGQKIEVDCGKGSDMERRVNVNHTNHPLAVPQRRAHRRANLVDADTATGLEPLVGLSIVGENCDLLHGHHIEDGPRNGNLRRATILCIPRSIQLELRVSIGVEKNDEPTIHEELVEDQIHHFLEHRFEFLDLNQDLGHLSEDLENALAGADLFGDLLGPPFETIVLIEL